ncbi:MAG: hypothetical protein ACJ8FY_28935 [Gemmataceae bacterium]
MLSTSLFLNVFVGGLTAIITGTTFDPNADMERILPAARGTAIAGW